MPGKIETVGLICKPRADRGSTVVPAVLAWLRGKGLNVRFDLETASYVNGEGGMPRNEVPTGTQLIIVLGGDGTLLAAARAVAGREIPLAAVNLGSLGFLTAITVDELFPQLEQVLEGKHTISRRRMLHVELWRQGKCIDQFEALNDAVLTKAEIARIIDLEWQIDDQTVCVFKGDGLIVATPTGSTAYSLSAGGPVVYPTVAAHCITPICAHMLTNRPVLVPDDRIIKIILHSGDRTYLTVDGQAGKLLAEGDEVICRRAEHEVLMILQPHMKFFDVLREKLSWGGR